jgi:mRNA-degrading endonuclease RelE of RelBE toxin-antitoxin system
VTDQPWAVRLSPQAAKTLTELPQHAKEMVRDILDIAVRSPWGWPQWNASDPEGEDVRAASIGQLSVVYVINRLTRHLSVLDIVWLG